MHAGSIDKVDTHDGQPASRSRRHSRRDETRSTVGYLVNNNMHIDACVTTREADATQIIGIGSNLFERDAEERPDWGTFVVCMSRSRGDSCMAWRNSRHDSSGNQNYRTNNRLIITTGRNFKHCTGGQGD